jgi:hypothetical protein
MYVCIYTCVFIVVPRRIKKYSTVFIVIEFIRQQKDTIDIISDLAAWRYMCMNTVCNGEIMIITELRFPLVLHFGRHVYGRTYFRPQRFEKFPHKKNIHTYIHM